MTAPCMSPFIARCRTPRRKCPRGHTLVEMAVTISLISGALLLVGGLLHTMFRADRVLRGQIVARASLARLALQFRDDAHAADSAGVAAIGGAAQRDATEEKSTLQFDLGDGRNVSYRAENGRVEREVRRGNKTLHRETYALSRDVAVRWLIDAADSPATATMLVDRLDAVAMRHDTVGPSVRVDAALGLHRRFIAKNRP